MRTRINLTARVAGRHESRRTKKNVVRAHSFRLTSTTPLIGFVDKLGDQRQSFFFTQRATASGVAWGHEQASSWRMRRAHARSFAWLRESSERVRARLSTMPTVTNARTRSCQSRDDFDCRVYKQMLACGSDIQHKTAACLPVYRPIDRRCASHFHPIARSAAAAATVVVVAPKQKNARFCVPRAFRRHHRSRRPALLARTRRRLLRLVRLSGCIRRNARLRLRRPNVAVRQVSKRLFMLIFFAFCHLMKICVVFAVIMAVCMAAAFTE